MRADVVEQRAAHDWMGAFAAEPIARAGVFLIGAANNLDEGELNMSDEQETDTGAGEQQAGAQSPFAESLGAYREFLQNCEQKAQDAYDKAVIVLSSGALGVSFAFVKDIVPLAHAACKPPRPIK